MCLYCCVSLNRLPTKLLNYKTPFEVLYSHPPSLSHIKTFGCLCYAACPNITDKFSPRAIPAVMLGYSLSKKGYILYDIHSKSLFVNRHVVFKEDLFPFKDLKTSSDPIFPVLILACPDTYSTDTCANPSIPLTDTPPTSVDPPTTLLSQPQELTLANLTSSPTDIPSSVPLRKSSRQSKPPLWLQDFVTQPKSHTCTFPLSNYMSYDHLSPSHLHALSAHSVVYEPSSYKEAALDPQWVHAMQLEIAALEANDTWNS